MNLDQILDQVANGEEILVSHRLKKHSIRLSAVYPNNSDMPLDGHPGLRTFDAAPKKLNPYNDFEDALQLAVAIRNGCKEFVTFNTQLAKVYKDLIQVKVRLLA